MVTINQLPVLLINQGGINVETPVKKYSKKIKTNKRGITDEQKKNDVKATAALLRTKQQRKS